MDNMKKDIDRLGHIDVLKGIGIILVVIGHMNYEQLGVGLYEYIYSFHMPLFFWITGYLFIANKKNQSYFEFLTHKFRKIYIPYTLLLMISLIFGKFIVGYLFKENILDISLENIIKALVFSSDYLNTIPIYNFPLWYLATLFVTVNIFYFFMKINSDKIKCGILIIVGYLSIIFQRYIHIIYTNDIQGRPPLHIDVIPVAFVFMGCGYLFKVYKNKLRISSLWLVPLFFLTIFLTYGNNANISSINKYSYYLSANISIFIFYNISKDFKNSKCLRYIGKNSLIIFGIHSLILKVYQRSYINNYILWNGNIKVIITLVYVLSFCCIVTYLFNKVYQKYFRTKKIME
jgi:fucose 4-O-acetylase-like acetyltransferase